MYKLASLFDGSGGFPLAGTLCGIRPVWASEVEPYPIAVTRERFPGMAHKGDISKINGAEVEPVDIITFGSPCQDLSVAGKRAGLKHTDNGDEETTRSGLFMEAVRIIKEMRAATNGKYPRFALWENVPGAFSSNKGEDFRIVLEELIKVVEPDAVMPPVPSAGWAYADSYSGDGWSLAYRVFDAQYWGVPQRRRRIHLIVDFRGKCAREVLFEREGVRGYFAEGRTPWQSLASYAKDCTGADDREGESHRGGRGRQLDAVTYDSPLNIIDSIDGQAERGWEGDIAPTLKATHYKNPPCITLPSAAFCAEQSARTRGIGYQEECAPTLCAGGTPACVYDARGNGDGVTVSTLTGDHENRITDYSSVICLQGNGIDRADTAGCNGKGWKEGTSYTLNTIDRPAVAYATDIGFFSSAEEQSPTLLARMYKDPHPVAYPESVTVVADHPTPKIGTEGKAFTPNARDYKAPLFVAIAQPPQYIVRRLTPTECARLQGFPDVWGHIPERDSLTDEECAFWQEVRDTYAAINGKPKKAYTATQLLTWYNKLHTDSAEYKMWGNGIALPPALYCMQGIVDAMNREDDDTWMQ